MSLQTPLAHVLGLGSAKQGSHHWWAQRLTAIALVPLCLWAVASIVSMAGADHATVVNWIQSPATSAMLIALIFALFYHTRLGLQVVVEDYIHTEWLKMTLLITINFAMILLGLAAAIAVLRTALGVQ